jgi:hypothetical protein
VKRALPLAALIVLAVLLTACAPLPEPGDTSDLSAARSACAGLPDPERTQCVIDRATQALNPDICSLLGIAVDDMCLQAVYEAADDPAICERLYLKGIRPTCRAYYADPQRVPRLLTPTPATSDAGTVSAAYLRTRSRLLPFPLSGEQKPPPLKTLSVSD